METLTPCEAPHTERPGEWHRVRTDAVRQEKHRRKQRYADNALPDADVRAEFGIEVEAYLEWLPKHHQEYSSGIYRWCGIHRVSHREPKIFEDRDNGAVCTAFRCREMTARKRGVEDDATDYADESESVSIETDTFRDESGERNSIVVEVSDSEREASPDDQRYREKKGHGTHESHDNQPGTVTYRTHATLRTGRPSTAEDLLDFWMTPEQVAGWTGLSVRGLEVRRTGGFCVLYPKELDSGHEQYTLSADKRFIVSTQFVLDPRARAPSHDAVDAAGLRYVRINRAQSSQSDNPKWIIRYNPADVRRYVKQTVAWMFWIALQSNLQASPDAPGKVAPPFVFAGIRPPRRVKACAHASINDCCDECTRTPAEHRAAVASLKLK